jgi:hypothetical protein
MADDLDSANRNEAATDADRSIPRRDGANAETGDRKYSRNTTDTNCISFPLPTYCARTVTKVVAPSRHRAIGVGRAQGSRTENQRNEAKRFGLTSSPIYQQTWTESNHADY